jgi:putative ABC transport system permease protein
MSWLWQDVRFGLRTILKDRGFFLVAVLALALGIGSTAAIFSVIDNVLLQPFPYTDGQRLYAINIHDSSQSGPDGREFFSVPEFLDYQRQNTIFSESMGIWETTVLLGDANAPESLDTDTVTGNTFQFLGVSALRGRGILPSDAKPGAPRVFVLSYKLWVSRFGLDPSIVGKTFLLDHQPTTLIGIMPPRFAFWGGDIWVPGSLDPTEIGAASRNYVMYGRLKPGLEPKAAEAEVRLLAGRFSKIYREVYPKHFDVHLHSLVDIAVGQFKRTLFMLLGAVGLLLLIGCANVANLLLAKTAGREKELAIRNTLGAGRFRIIRQLLVESVLLAMAGAALGCLLAAAGLKGLVAILPQFTFPDEAVIELNTPVLLATLAIAVLTALIFGTVPALIASQKDLNDPLKASGRGNSSFGRARFRNVLIVSEVALSLLLLTGAGLLMHSFFLERQVDLGMRTDHLLVTRLNLPAQQYPSTDSQARFLRELLLRIEKLPGVVSAAGSLEIPRQNGAIPSDFEVAGSTHSEEWKGYMAPCSWQSFQTLGTRLIAGRLLTAADETGKRRIAVINRSMAAKYFGRQNPIGGRLQLLALKTAPEPVPNPWFEIVGVVSDTKNEGVRAATAPQAYIPYTIAGYGAYSVFVRTIGDPNAFSKVLTREVLTLDRSVIPQGTLSMDDVLEQNEYAKPRFGLIIFAVFAAIGLMLVSVGVYSVISYAVTQQQREIGIRMALGASAADVRTLVVKGGLRFLLAGVGIGLLLALVMARLLASQVWGVSWYDPLTLGGVVAVLIAVGLVASYLPSLRATRVDPAICLRIE